MRFHISFLEKPYAFLPNILEELTYIFSLASISKLKRRIIAIGYNIKKMLKYFIFLLLSPLFFGAIV